MRLLSFLGIFRISRMIVTTRTSRLATSVSCRVTKTLMNKFVKRFMGIRNSKSKTCKTIRNPTIDTPTWCRILQVIILVQVRTDRRPYIKVVVALKATMAVEWIKQILSVKQIWIEQLKATTRLPMPTAQSNKPLVLNTNTNTIKTTWWWSISMEAILMELSSQGPVKALQPLQHAQRINGCKICLLKSGFILNPATVSIKIWIAKFKLTLSIQTKNLIKPVSQAIVLELVATKAKTILLSLFLKMRKTKLWFSLIWANKRLATKSSSRIVTILLTLSFR